MIECVATDRAVVLNAAVPPPRVPVPSVVAPSLKVTVPVAVDGLTEAVKVTFAPKVAGLSDVMTEVVVVAWLTTCANGDDVLVMKLALPPYTAVME